MGQFNIPELKLAFGYHFVRLILETDAVITISETDYLQRIFPREQMSKVGFIGSDGGFTERHTEAMREAIERLPVELGLDERLEFLTTFLAASVADGEFDTEEGSVMMTAATMLAIPGDALDAHLESLDDVGTIDLPEPEQE